MSKKFKIDVRVVVVVFIAGLILNIGLLKTDLIKQKTQYEETVQKSQETIQKSQDELDKVKKELETTKKNTEEYRSLNETEKKIVDQAIADTKKSTEEEKQKKIAEEEAKKKAEEEEKKRQEEERKAQEQAQKEAEEQARREAEAHKYETGLTWEDIARDGHVGEYCQFTGEIIQVMNGSSYNQYRVKIDGDYNKVMLIQINKSQITSNLLEDDTIFFRGKSCGIYTYTTVMGAEMSIPSVIVDDFQRQ